MFLDSDGLLIEPVECGSSRVPAPTLANKEKVCKEDQRHMVLLGHGSPALAVVEPCELFGGPEKALYAPPVTVEVLDNPTPPLGIAAHQEPKVFVSLVPDGDDSDLAPAREVGGHASRESRSGVRTRLGPSCVWLRRRQQAG